MAVRSLDNLTELERKTVVAFIADVREALRENVLKAVVYGSKSRGDATEGSDIDVMLIVKNDEMPIREEICNILVGYKVDTGLPIEIAIFSEEAYNFIRRIGVPFAKEVEKEGIAL